jgi:prevent-host-death family protein
MAKEAPPSGPGQDAPLRLGKGSKPGRGPYDMVGPRGGKAGMELTGCKGTPMPSTHRGPGMQTVQVRNAKASFSALVEAAERGEPTTITKHGRPAAVMVPVDVARRIYPGKADFAEFLMAFPGGDEFDRDQTPMRSIDL